MRGGTLQQRDVAPDVAEDVAALSVHRAVITPVPLITTSPANAAVPTPNIPFTGLGDLSGRADFDVQGHIWRQLLQLCDYNKLGHADRTGTSPGAPSPWQPKLHSMF